MIINKLSTFTSTLQDSFSLWSRFKTKNHRYHRLRNQSLERDIQKKRDGQLMASHADETTGKLRDESQIPLFSLQSLDPWRRQRTAWPDAAALCL